MVTNDDVEFSMHVHAGSLPPLPGSQTERIRDRARPTDIACLNGVRVRRLGRLRRRSDSDLDRGSLGILADAEAISVMSCKSAGLVAALSSGGMEGGSM